MKKVPDTTLSWLAALIDGEGSIMLLKRVRSSKQRKLETIQYRSSVTISNTDLRLLRAVVRKTGVNRIYKHVRPPSDKNRTHKRASYTWRMIASEIKVWLPLLIPWLVLKRRQAALVLKHLETADKNTCRKGEPRRIIDRRSSHKAYEEIRNLNSGWRRRFK